jgi:hypothetical protein
VQAGHPNKFSFWCYYNGRFQHTFILNTLGATIGANLAGEVRSVRSLSYWPCLVRWLFNERLGNIYGLSYKIFGNLWTNALMLPVRGLAHAAYPFGAYEPFATIITGYSDPRVLSLFS